MSTREHEVNEPYAIRRCPRCGFGNVVTVGHDPRYCEKCSSGLFR